MGPEVQREGPAVPGDQLPLRSTRRLYTNEGAAWELVAEVARVRARATFYDRL